MSANSKILCFTFLLIILNGCTLIDPNPKPDLAAITKVISDAYSVQGIERPVIFLNTDDFCDLNEPTCLIQDDSLFPELKIQIETELHLKVRPISDADYSDPTVSALTPILPETGEIGVTISLGRFSEDNEGVLHVNVSIFRSGLDGVFVEYILEASQEGWIIIDTIYDQAIP